MAASSGFLSVGTQDLLKGLAMAVIAALITSLYSVINAGNWPTHADWIETIRVAVTSGLAYLLKNFLTNSNNQILKTDKQ